jgi:hypothetical protein
VARDRLPVVTPTSVSGCLSVHRRARDVAVLFVLFTAFVAAPAKAETDFDLSGHRGLAAVEAPAAAVQSAPQVEKSQYHLLNPTPRDRMRPMSTDRPDRTESPYTVDAGHFQLEMDILQYMRDREKGTRIERWQIAPMNLKVGLLNNIDLQLLVETYIDELTVDRHADIRERKRGFGDLTTRLKINFWGNDGGSTAFAMMPFIAFPTNQDGLGNTSVEGGVIFPLAVELPLRFRMGLMTEFDFVRDTDRRGHHTEFINSITFARDIVGALGGYVEFFSQTSSRGGRWVGTVDVGLTYGVTEDIQIDAGVNVGVTRAAQDVNPFVGLSVRF